MSKANPNHDQRVGTGYNGYRFLMLDGKLQRRLVTVVGDKAFVHSLKNNHRRSDRQTAFIVKPHVLFKTEAEAQGGQDVDIFVCHDDEYEKLRGRDVGDSYVSVSSSGDLHKIYGEMFLTEREALDFCLRKAAEHTWKAQQRQRRLQVRLKELNARQTTKDRSDARKVARKQSKRRRRSR